ncbi:MAG: 1-deoxy-D-xylulose-5-phosphate reductoisomerase [Deltaproteobacteria bacterium]|nr:1-deoxy-D-xylulose-5-phosphate reductoisomerase [Deltaproteobacteria bacterium]
MARRSVKENKRKSVAVIGSTGSIGRSTLDVVRRNPGRFKVVSLAAGRNTKLLKKQIREFAPAYVSVIERGAAEEIKREFTSREVEVGFGSRGMERAAAFGGADITVSAIVGFAGFLPTLAAIKAGKDVALANKETLVAGGSLVMKEVKKHGGRLIPVDSEHSAVFQSLAGHRIEDVKRILLTASGGPFLRLPAARLGSVTPKEALRHPTWSMGRRITIDSATLMNKGFEVIEARWLFGMPADRISVCIHPQSVVHSMVEYVDGSIVAEMGSSDMRVPIGYALSYPRRVEASAGRFDIMGKKLEFFEPDPGKFPCLSLAYTALSLGETAPCVLNAADEVCVEMFLKGGIGFTDIYRVLSTVLEGHDPRRVRTVEDIVEADRWGRKAAEEVITKGRRKI